MNLDVGDGHLAFQPDITLAMRSEQLAEGKNRVQDPLDEGKMSFWRNQEGVCEAKSPEGGEQSGPGSDLDSSTHRFWEVFWDPFWNTFDTKIGTGKGISDRRVLESNICLKLNGF